MPAKEIPIGCGEWGFRDIPMREHFVVAQQLGFHWLEFGIGGQFNRSVLVAAAVGVGGDTEDRVAALVHAHVDVIVCDTAHGHTRGATATVTTPTSSVSGTPTRRKSLKR